MKKPILAATASLTLIASAQAHPTGHEGGFWHNAKHMLTQPDHLLMLVGAVAIVGFIVFKLLSPAKK